jgi:hypothetical protein
LPVEAMVQVGMAKQQAYEQNVTKIQSQIDNIAGLDIVKDPQKKYLQSKLNELGNRLNRLASADFSNFQLVNAVGGMTGQIVKDKYIQSAVNSTKVLRKGMADMETARKSGKSSPENEWWWNKQVNGWLNDGSIETQFNGSFVEYRDINKKLFDVAEKIKEVDNSIDIPYKRDNAGNVLYFDSRGNASTDPSKGRPILDDAILRIKTKGKPAEKLLNAFYDNLDENDKQQLMITGNYHYRNVTKETLKSDIINVYKEKEKMLSDYVVNLSVKLKTDAGLTDVERQQMEAVLKTANEKLNSGQLKKEQEQELRNIDQVSNLDDYKYRIYTQKYLTNQARDLSYQSIQQEILNNPYAQMDMERKKLAQQYAQMRQQHSQWAASHSLSVQRLGFERQKWEVEQINKEQDRLKNQPIVVPGRTRTDVAGPTLLGLDNDIKNREKQLAMVNSEYGALLFPKLKGTERQKALDGLLAQYNQNPKSIKDNNKRDYVELARGIQIDIMQKNTLFKTVDEGSKGFDQQIEKVLQGKGGINFKDGRQLYSAKEIYSVIESSNKYTNIPGATGGTGSMAGAGATFNVNAFLAEHKGKRTEALAMAIAKNATGQKLTPTEKTLHGRFVDLKREINPTILTVSENKLKWQSGELSRRMPEYQTMEGTLSKKNETDMDRVSQLITQKRNEYNEFGSVGTYNKGDFNPTVISEMLKKTDVGYTISKNYDGSASLIITSGDKRQIVPMNAAEFSTYFPSYATTNPITNIKYAILASQNKTTNITGGVDPVNAYISGYSLPGVADTPLAPKVRVDVEGSPRNNGSGSDRFQVRLYYNTNSGWKNAIVNNQGYATEDGVQEILRQIGPATIESMLKQ